MGRKSTSRSRRLPGLYCREDGYWQIDKVIKGKRLSESTGERDYESAERYALQRITEIKEAEIYGVRPRRTFRQAATKYLQDEIDKKSIGRDAQALKLLDPYIGDLPLDKVHMGTLQSYIEERLSTKIKVGTINRDLATVRRILNLAARMWRHEGGGLLALKLGLMI